MTFFEHKIDVFSSLQKDQIKINMFYCIFVVLHKFRPALNRNSHKDIIVILVLIRVIGIYQSGPNSVYCNTFFNVVPE